MGRSIDDVVGFLRGLDPSAHVVPPGAGSVPITGLTHDSTASAPGYLFAALPGARHHGVRFAPDAAARGAAAVLSDRPVRALPTVVVAAPRTVLGPLASWLHDDPSRHVRVHGVTGTNGKTSTVHLLASGLHAAARRAGSASSLEVALPGVRRSSARTTAEAPAVQATLAEARAAGVTDFALEVSSHGLALQRVAGVRFRTGVFTNLSADHLDLHQDLEQYYAAKASLFVPERCALAVVCVDDEHGRRLAAETRCPVVTVSARDARADWRADRVRATAAGTRFRLSGPGTDREVALALLGPHQVDNALCVIAALHADGVDVDAAVRGVEATLGVPGRLERIEAGQPFLALVDFAHNVGGQRRVLPFLRSLTDRCLIAVVGATGERDASKRAALGAQAAAWADVVVVTDESPHSEEPAMLRAAVAAGARQGGTARVVVEPDRGRALAVAVAAAGPGDVVVVAGRGADPTLAAAGGDAAFDDREMLRAALAASPSL